MKLLSKIRNSRLLKSGLLLGINDLTSALFQLLMSVYILHTKAAAPFGALAIAQSGSIVVSSLSDLGLELHGVRFLAQSTTDTHVSTVARITTTRLIVFLCLSLLFVPLTKSLGYSNFTIQCLILLLPGNLAILLAPLFYYRASGNVTKMARTVFAVRIACMVIIFLSFYNTKSILVYAAGWSFLNILVAAVMFFGISGIAQGFRSNVHNLIDFSLLKGSAMIFVTNLLKASFVYGNAYLLGAFVLDAEVARYSLPDKIIRSGLLCTNGVLLLALGELTVRAKRGGSDLPIWFKKIQRIVLSITAVAFIAFLALGYPILDRIFPKLFPSCHTQYLACALLLIFIPMNGLIYGSLLYAVNQDKKVFGALAAAGSINISLAVLLIPKLHSLGMAISVTISEGFLFVLGLFLVRTVLAVKGIESELLSTPSTHINLETSLEDT